MQLSLKRRKPDSQALAVVALAEAPVMTWRRAMEVWGEKLVGRSKATAATYTSAVRAFFETPGAPDLADLEIEALDSYANVLRSRAKEGPPGQRIATATVGVKLAAMRSFLRFCLNRHWLPLLSELQIKDALEGIPTKVQRPYQVVEGDELAAMLQAASEDSTDAPRTLALIALALGAGLRISELVALDVRHIAADGKGFYVDVQEGKGRKDRQVPISEDVYSLVLAYLELSGRTLSRSADRATPLFLSRKCRTSAGRLSVRHARQLIYNTAERAGLESTKHITPHSLRHSYALRVLQGDKELDQAPAPLPAVSKLLGHSSLTVTGRYLAHFERQELAVFAPVLRKPIKQALEA